MASLLTAKQIGNLLKQKRKQYVESVVGLGQHLAVPKNAAADATPVLTARDPTVLVFTIRSLPNRAALSARKQFREAGLQLRKVPNGVVKAAARNTPFEWMMSGPTLVATPLPGKKFELEEIVNVAASLRDNDKINKGLLFSGLVHHHMYMTPQRLKELDFEEPKKIPGLILHPVINTIGSLNYARVANLATLNAFHEKKAKEGDAEAAKFVAEKQ